MAKRPPGAGGLIAVLGFVFSCVGLLIYLWHSFGGPIPLEPQGYRFTAVYRNATQLIAQTDVRMAGVDVGHVVSVAQDGELTRAEIELTPADAPIPTDTTTVLRRKTLLGEPFIQLIPGTPDDQGGTMLAEGGQLPLGQTERSVDLDEALRAFNRPTRRDLRLILNELALGVKDQGSALNGALGNLRPTTEAGADVLGTLSSQDQAVHSLIRDSGATFQALSERRGDLRTLVAAGNRVLATTASRDHELNQTVKLLPPALQQLRPTLALAQDVGTHAAPLLRELGPASRQLAPTISDLHDVAPDVEGLMHDLGPLLDAAPAGIPAFTHTLASARPLVRELRPALQDAIPTVQWLIPYKRELAAWLTKLGTATESSAGPEGRHILRTMIPLNLEGLGVYADKPLGQNRHNAYSKPGYLDAVGRPFARAFDCENATGPDLGFAPPCVTQGPFSFNGHLSDFPQVRRAP
ncbi:MAG TPA: MlaD family protein [Solirubrobacterales bacterium]|nr:MlaD family protein [Solirubrobacterales bacterium]